jgi:hypothetical protein
MIHVGAKHIQKISIIIICQDLEQLPFGQDALVSGLIEEVAIL